MLKLINRFLAAQKERKALARLSEMDDRLLRDIGLSRHDIVAAVYGEIYRPRSVNSANDGEAKEQSTMSAA